MPLSRGAEGGNLREERAARRRHGGEAPITFPASRDLAREGQGNGGIPDGKQLSEDRF